MLVSLEHHASGLRVRLIGQRCHHGAVGCLLCLFRRTRKLGVALCLHDLRDYRGWFRGGWQG